MAKALLSISLSNMASSFWFTMEEWRKYRGLLEQKIIYCWLYKDFCITFHISIFFKKYSINLQTIKESCYCLCQIVANLASVFRWLAADFGGKYMLMQPLWTLSLIVEDFLWNDTSHSSHFTLHAWSSMLVLLVVVNRVNVS